MKKKLVILSFLLFAMLSVFANDSFRCYAINARCTYSNWEGWRNCDISGVFDINGKTITIYSKDTQVFEYENLKKEESLIDYVTYSGEVTDISNKKAYMIIRINFDGTKTIHFKYPDGEYMYLIDKLMFNQK